MTLPKTRKEAINIKSKVYYTGKPCQRGHLANRYTCDGYCLICRNSWKEANKERVQRHKAKWEERNQGWKKSVYDRRKADGLCPKCKTKCDTDGVLCSACRVSENGRGKRLRSEAIAAYGSKCQCPGGCDIVEPKFLAFDHINNGGGKDRATPGKRGPRGLVHWLKKNGYPKGEYRLLCHNCNSARWLYGVCPHEGEDK